LDDVKSLTLGQHSATFQQQLKKLAGRIDPPRTEVPPTAEELTSNNMHRYYYRSFSVEFHKEDSIDIVMDTATDFEAIIVALHRRVTSVKTRRPCRFFFLSEFR